MKRMLIFLACSSIKLVAQPAYTASFIATLGIDTVIVETYNMLPNHLYGKAFLRYPEDIVANFDFHFYPDGSIRHYSISLMNPDSSYVTSLGIQGVFCEKDSCTWFGSWPGMEMEYRHKHAARHMDFIGGWTPTISLIEWNCMRLIKSGEQTLPLTMVNDYIGVRQVAMIKGNKDTVLFGGPFLEYTRLNADPDGRILAYDGTGTPWNYIVTKHPPIDVDSVARRMSKNPKIGIPSPEGMDQFILANDTIKVSYGRPSKRGRKIFGGVVPYDSVWRTGAGDPTKINLPYDIKFGKTIIPKGSYSIYTIPRKDEWSLIFNKDLKQWPTDPDRSKDFAIIPMKWRKPGQQQERFTILIEPAKEGGVIRFTWDDTEAYAPFTIAAKN